MPLPPQKYSRAGRQAPPLWEASQNVRGGAPLGLLSGPVVSAIPGAGLSPGRREPLQGRGVGDSFQRPPLRPPTTVPGLGCTHGARPALLGGGGRAHKKEGQPGRRTCLRRSLPALEPFSDLPSASGAPGALGSAGKLGLGPQLQAVPLRGQTEALLVPEQQHSRHGASGSPYFYGSTETVYFLLNKNKKFNF